MTLVKNEMVRRMVMHIFLVIQEQRNQQGIWYKTAS